MRGRLFLSVILLFLLSAVSQARADVCRDGFEQCRQSSWRTIDLKEAKRRYDAYSALFIDARAFPRYSEGTIMRALDLPIRRFKRMLKWLPSDREAPIVVFCDGPKCGLASKLAERLVKKG